MTYTDPLTPAATAAVIERVAERLRLYGTMDEQEAFEEAERIVRERNWARMQRLCGADAA